MPYKDLEAKRASNRKYQAEHLEVYRANRLKYEASHQEERRAARHRYLAADAGYAMQRASNNHYTAMKRGAVVDAEFANATLAAILRDREECDWCELPTPLRERIIDHRVAIVFGGQHTESNIQILCKPCDKTKTGAENSLMHSLRKGATQSDFALVA